MNFYHVFKNSLKFTLRMYYRKVRIEGLENVPRNRPLLVTPNHQNAFLDAFFAGGYIPIHLHHLTRSDVFNWWSTPLLGLLNMMPIYRIRDGYSKLSQNDAVFETCKALFKEGKSVLIFAEGNHGENHYLRPLTKGAARIAVFSQAEMDEELLVLPVGVNYFNHYRARSGAVVVFGKPIPVKKFHEQYTQEGVKALNAMRDAISDGMKATLVIPEKTPDYEEKKNAIFQEKHIGMSFSELKNVPTDTQSTPWKKQGRIAKILNPLPFLVIKKVISGTKDVVFHSSLKFAIGLILFPVWWLLIFSIFSFTLGIPIALLAVFVMVFGLFYSYS